MDRRRIPGGRRPGELIGRRLLASDRIWPNDRIANEILAWLPAEEFNRLLPCFRRVRLQTGETICMPNRAVTVVYFPKSGMISMVATMRDGATVEVGIVGREGFVSAAVLLGVPSIPVGAVVQIEGDAFAIEPSLLRKMLCQSPRFESMLRHFANAYWNQVAQVAACNGLHRVHERLARWLLMSRDRIDSDSVPLTQEFLAQMLGCSRSSIAAAMGSLEKTGVVLCGRGHVRIMDRTKLERTACECYEVTRRMLASSVRA